MNGENTKQSREKLAYKGGIVWRRFTDPVCRMQLDEKDATHSLVHQGHIYYFCSVGCQAEFQRHPEDYVKSKPAEKGEQDV